LGSKVQKKGENVGARTWEGLLNAKARCSKTKRKKKQGERRESYSDETTRKQPTNPLKGEKKKKNKRENHTEGTDRKGFKGNCIAEKTRGRTGTGLLTGEKKKGPG